MSLQLPLKEWFTAQEIADAALPDLPNTMQAIADLAKRQDWRGNPDFARRRSGRGGGWEYHWRLFPARAQRELISRVNPPDAPKARLDRGEVWAWFDGLPDSVKDKARRALRILQEVEALAPATTKFLAVGMVAKQHGISDRTIWGWFEKVEGVDLADRLAYLAPRHRAAKPKRKKAQAAPEFYDLLKGLYLRLEAPGFAHCWRDAVKICKGNGLAYLTEKTARRWLDANVREIDQVFAREGMSGLRRRYPPQIRDRSTLAALEIVNADCHKIDVFVQWPGIAKPVRPQLIGWQDVYSGKILAWEFDLNPNKVAVMQTFMKLMRDYGVPKHCLFDNGMEFANKDMTGQEQSRKRFRVTEDEPVGILGMLGIGMSFATVAHGQAKPIERAFKDFAEDIAKDPRFAGAYVGNHIDAKPENYMSKAIDLDYFIAVVEEGIHEHNARLGRRSHTAQGRSFDATFAESYQRTPIRKATEEQLRLCLMATYVRKLHKHNGLITLYRNEYWSEWMSEIAGQQVTARFNPEDLHEGAYIYTMAGEYLGYAECRKKSPFRDIASAKALARDNRRRLRDAKGRLDELRPLSVGDIAERLDALPKPQAQHPEAVVVQLDRLNQIEQRKRSGGLIKPAVPVPNTADEERLNVFTANFRKPEPAVESVEESAADRFRRMLDIERRIEAGEAVSRSEAEELARVRRLPEFQAMRTMFDVFGEAAIG